MVHFKSATKSLGSSLLTAVLHKHPRNYMSHTQIKYMIDHLINLSITRRIQWISSKNKQQPFRNDSSVESLACNSQVQKFMLNWKQQKNPNMDEHLQAWDISATSAEKMLAKCLKEKHKSTHFMSTINFTKHTDSIPRNDWALKVFVKSNSTRLQVCLCLRESHTYIIYIAN